MFSIRIRVHYTCTVRSTPSAAVAAAQSHISPFSAAHVLYARNKHISDERLPQQSGGAGPGQHAGLLAGGTALPGGPSPQPGQPGSLMQGGGGSSVSGSPTTGYLGGMGGAGGHTPGSSSPGSEMSPQHNESPPAPAWPGEMKHHPHPHAPPHSHHHPHTAGHHPPPPPPPPHHAGYMPQYSWYQTDPNPGLLTVWPAV
uniref:Uncharacterized protein n=1 Tax=Trichogramma kaykai TaxID=54128 RepID=A0ABD2VWM7_9HYME